MERKCQIIHLYNTNESPLWNLNPRLLTDVEEFLPDEYFAYLGHMVGAEVVIIMGQADTDSGVLALDMEGMPVEIPKLSVEKLREHLSVTDPERLAKMDPEKLAQLVLEASRK
jgi:ribosome biogenesis SPOUT family RNA methylase Rps3